jgi:hypothetical protein
MREDRISGPNWGCPAPLASHPTPQLAMVLDGVGAAIDAMGGSFLMSYATAAVTAARTNGT